MRQAWDCIARTVCLQIQAGGIDNIQELLDANDAVYLDMGGAHKFLFPDGSILIIDDEGNSSFVNIQFDEKKPTEPPKPTWLNRLKKNKVTAVLAVGGILLSSAAIAGAIHFNKQ